MCQSLEYRLRTFAPHANEALLKNRKDDAYEEAEKHVLRKEGCVRRFGEGRILEPPLILQSRNRDGGFLPVLIVLVRTCLNHSESHAPLDAVRSDRCHV